MAVTLYRCQKCRGLFNAVFEPNKWCRDCKLNQTSGGTSKSSLANTFTVLTGAEELTIIEPEEAMSGSKSSAIGGPIGDAQNVFAQQQAAQYQQGLQNAASLMGLMGGQSSLQNFSGGSEIRSPFIYSDSSFNVGDSFVGDDGVRRVIASVRRLDDSRLMVIDSVGFIGIITAPIGTGDRAYAAPTRFEPKPESSPHESILKPSRKLKFAAE